MSDAMHSLAMLREEGRAIGVALEGLRTVPGWLVHATTGTVAVLVLLAADFGGLSGPSAPLVQALALVLALALVVRPRAGWQGGFLVLVGLRVLGDDPAAWPRLAALLLVTHALVLAATLAARTPWGSRVELAVPGALLRRAWPVQAGLQALALVAVVLTGTVQGPVWRIAALAAAIGVVVVVLPPRRRAAT